MKFVYQCYIEIETSLKDMEDTYQLEQTVTNIMHLSMLNPRVGWGGATHGKLTQRAFLRVGILTFESCPGVRNLTLLRPVLGKKQYPAVGI